ncbi:MAG: thiosulfate oxidation carrier protein SoxY [Paracoccaceae bacterium]|nr:thiosulfate oxidation carrier protein SoxY [Paracoccaceae bacterium]
MAMTRRCVLLMAAAAAFLPGGAAGNENGVMQAIAEFTGGATPLDGGVNLLIPEIADNGGAVPVRVEAAAARRIALFTDGNPYPGVAVFSLGRLASSAAAIRIRLAGSQTVIAVAELADGSYRQATRSIAVTVGGCA